MAAELGIGTGQGAAADAWLDGGCSALHLAAANGKARVCRYLVEDLGFPVNSRSSAGEMPLVLAATSGHTATAAYLLERGADPRAPDSHGQTPLHWAACNGTCVRSSGLRRRPTRALILG
jgi:ankyrin repeat protein